MPPVSLHEKKLTERYLLWFYKKGREDLERVDRKFTQLTVDRYLLRALSKNTRGLSVSQSRRYAQLLSTFSQYIARKERDARRERYAPGARRAIRGEYVFLKNRVVALEKAIVHFLGKKGLTAMRSLYHGTMTRRILSSTEE